MPHSLITVKLLTLIFNNRQVKTEAPKAFITFQDQTAKICFALKILLIAENMHLEVKDANPKVVSSASNDHVSCILYSTLEITY